MNKIVISEQVKRDAEYILKEYVQQSDLQHIYNVSEKKLCVVKWSANQSFIFDTSDYEFSELLAQIYLNLK